MNSSLLQCLNQTGPLARGVGLAVLLLVGSAPVRAQDPATAAAAGVIRGMVKSGNTAIPGVVVTASNTLTGQKAVTSTDVSGNYVLTVPADGRYVVRAQMAAFAPATQEVVINATSRQAKVDLEIVLLSRAQQNAQAEQKQMAAAAASVMRGFQSLSVMQGEGGGGIGGGDQSSSSDMPIPGLSSGTATESVSVSGNTTDPMANMSSEEMRARFEEFREAERGFGGGGGNMAFGPGGGGGGGGGGGPAFLFFGGGGRGRFNLNRPHGSVYYTVGDDVLNAAPYSLTGQRSNKPAYLQNRFGGSLGGPLNIPKIFSGGNKTFFFVNYNGSRSENPYDAYSTVPTLAERLGDFSSSTILVNQGGQSSRLPVQLYNICPTSPCNNLSNSTTPISPTAQSLLKYIPLPNLAGAPPDTQNFHYITTANNDSDDLNVRVNRSFGASQGPPIPLPGRSRGPQNSVNFGFHYHSSSANLTDPFPTVGGTTSVRSFDIPLGYVRSIGKVTNIARVDFNRSRTQTQNLYAFSQNIIGGLGISGVSQDPFNWGLPNLSFTDFGSVTDTNPELVRNQTWSFSDFMIWNHAKHTLRWGGDFRRIQLNTEASNDARGTFVFTGENTSNQQALGTGFDFADFLLGLPQQTRLQTTQPGANNYHFRGNSWDLFLQDNWRLRGNLTLNIGLRYEYISPYTELNNRIANLDLSSAFLASQDEKAPTSVALVLPGGASPYHGTYPTTLMRPDRNNFAPRVGIAWKPLSKMVVRAGYGINYNTSAYQSIVQNLAFQPPFATTATNVETASGELTLQNGFPAPAQPVCQTTAQQGCQITNTYAVNPNYRLGYAQIWNLNIQQEIRPTLLLNVDYTGTKGANLDILEAPNRDLAGVRVPTVDSFNWESSGASSHLSAGSVRLRKRLQRGVSIGGTYKFSKSIDDASSIGNGASAGATNVAQDPFNLAAERGLSSFNQTHKFTADYLWELPFGHDKRWLTNASPWRAIVGDWQWSGDWTIASGLPFTPRALGNFSDVNRGTNGTLRADVIPGQPVTLSNPSIGEWFNTAAFEAPPHQVSPITGECTNPPGFPCYGDARRNSIIGPGSLVFDMVITKVFPLAEGRVLEFRGSASNVFNHPQYASIDTMVTSPTFGRVTSVGAMRTVTLTARFRF
jgi:trimeric autotransporter adhesin